MICHFRISEKKMREDANVISLRVHTYIIDHYNPSIRIIDLVSHTNYVVCVLILYISGGTYSFKVDSERQIFLRNFPWQFYFNTKSFCQKSAERKPPKKYFSYFRTLALRLIIYLPDYGDFESITE